MGFLETLGLEIDLEEVAENDFNVPADWYEFVIKNVDIRESKAGDSFIVIDYQLGDEGLEKQEWFGLPKDMTAPTAAEIKKLGYWKRRLKDLGVADADLNKVGPEELIGLHGTLEVFDNVSKGVTYQNIRNVSLSEDEPTVAPEEQPAVKKAVAKAPAKAAAAGVRPNPFAK